MSFSFWQGIWSDPLGFLAGSLPAKPASITSGNIPQLQAASLDGVTDHAVLVTGKWPGQFPASAADPIPAAMPASTAALLKLRPGDVLRVQDQDTGAPVTFILTGLYAERQSPASVASYWQLNSIPASGSVNGTGSASGYTTYGPLVVSPSMFPGRLAEGTGTWVAQPDMAGFNAADLFAISIEGDSSLLSGLTLTTNLPTVLADTGDNFAVARSLLGISAVELLVLTVAALLAVARLLAAQREGETALLTARGATRWQLTRLTAAEVIPLSLVTALIGGVAGIWLARLLGSTLYGPGTAAAASRTAASAWPPRAPGSTRWPPRWESPCCRLARSSTRCCGLAGPQHRSSRAGGPCSPARRGPAPTWRWWRWRYWRAGSCAGIRPSRRPRAARRPSIRCSCLPPRSL